IIATDGLSVVLLPLVGLLLLNPVIPLVFCFLPVCEAVSWIGWQLWCLKRCVGDRVEGAVKVLNQMQSRSRVIVSHVVQRISSGFVQVGYYVFGICWIVVTHVPYWIEYVVPAFRYVIPDSHLLEEKYLLKKDNRIFNAPWTAEKCYLLRFLTAVPIRFH